MSRLLVIASSEPVDYVRCAGRLTGGSFLQDAARAAEGSYQREDEWIVLRDAGTDYRDYDPSTLALVTQKIVKPHLLFVRSNSERLLDEFVLTLPIEPNILVDNTHGLMLSVGEAQDLARSDQRWLDLVEL